jgi:hypothetical protein
VKLHYVSSGPYGVAAGEQDGAEAHCPDGMSVLGGGVYNGSLDLGVNVNTSYPIDNDSDGILNDGWAADVNNASTEFVSFAVWAVCTPATSVSFGASVP